MKKFLITIIGLFLVFLSNAQVIRGGSMVMPPSGPTINESGQFGQFNTTTGTASTAQSITFIGTGLTNNVVVTISASGLEISKDNITFTTSLTYTGPPTISGTIYGRIPASAANGTYTGNVSISSVGASTVNVPYTAVVGSSPSMSVSPLTITNLNSTAGTPGTPQTFNVTFGNVPGSITVTTFSPVEISQDGGSTWSSSTQVFSTGSPKTISARVAASASAGSVSGNISVSGPSVTTQNVAVSGTVSSPSGTDTIAVQFNTSSGAGYDQSGWLILKGDPGVSTISASLNGFTATTGPTTNWTPPGSGHSASANNGTTQGTVFPWAPLVMKECFFQFNSVFDANKYQLKISGFRTDGSTYRAIITSSVSSSITGFNCNSNYVIIGASTYGPFTLNAQPSGVENKTGFVGDGSHFNSMSPDATGSFYIFFYPVGSTGSDIPSMSAIVIRKN